MSYLARSLCLLLPLVGLAAEVRAEDARHEGRHVRVALVSEHTSLRPGETAWVGLRFRPDAKWHLYWRNPGDSGAPPEVEWNLPPRFRSGPIRWPAPRRRVEGPLVTYVYEGDLLLPVELRVPADASAGTVELEAKVRWLVCHDECIPGSATLRLSVPVSPERPSPNDEHAAAFAEARALLPQPLEGARAEVTEDGTSLLLGLGHDGSWQEGDPSFEVFPWKWNVLDPTAEAEAVVGDVEATLRVALAPRRKEPPPAFGGVVVVERGAKREAFAVDVTVRGSSSQDEQGDESGGTAWWWIPVLVLLVGAVGLGLRRRSARTSGSD